MKQGIFIDKLPSLPLFITLDVVRDIYCSQEIVDNISKYLWTKKPEFIQELSEYETIEDVMLSHTGHYAKICEWILVHLMEEMDEDIRIPDTPLGRLDLLYEISRRIRTSLDIVPLETFGHPLFETRSGPFLDMIFLPVIKSGNHKEDISQELTDKTILKAYISHTELFYDYAEQKRLFIFSYEIQQALEMVIWDIKPKEQKENGAFLGKIMQEINARLNYMCGFDEDMKRRGYIA